MNEGRIAYGLGFGFGTVVLLAIILLLWAGPNYRVWSRMKAGQAELAQADWNRKIAIREAEAKHQSAKALAQAEIERARGVAQANQIIGNSLKGNDDYLRYLWIDRLEAGENREVIYVPTEGGIPILEAGRLKR